MPIRAEDRHLYTGPKWQLVRAQVRERAGDRCENCGAKNGATYLRGKVTSYQIAPQDRHDAELQGNKVVLIQCGAAHRNGIPGDDRPLNLAWWCRGCHLRADRGHHHRSRANRKDSNRPILELAASV